MWRRNRDESKLAKADKVEDTGIWGKDWDVERNMLRGGAEREMAWEQADDGGDGTGGELPATREASRSVRDRGEKSRLESSFRHPPDRFSIFPYACRERELAS